MNIFERKKLAACRHCGWAVDRDELEQHQLNCAMNIRKKCIVCEMEVPGSIYKEHRKNCHPALKGGRREIRIKETKVEGNPFKNRKRIALLQKAIPSTKAGKLKGDCSICLQTFHPYTTIRKLLCQHIFHTQCVDQWLQQHKSCPYCRQSSTKSTI